MIKLRSLPFLLFVLPYKPLKKIFGNNIVTFYSKVLGYLGKIRAKPLAKFLKVDVDQVDELTKIQDFEDRVFGVEGYWKKKGKFEGVKVEIFCPFARFVDGEFCRKAVFEFEMKTFQTLNKNYSLSIEGKLLSEGGEGCIFVHKLKIS